MPNHPLAGAARAAPDGRSFFEARFRPGPEGPAHVTGYFEPELDAASFRNDAFPVPLHVLPDGGCDLSRAEIDRIAPGHEIAWVRDEVDRFFAQVQGSARLRLTDGRRLRIGYAGTNGHPYRSIGRHLLSQGVFGPDITADALKSWLRADPDRGRVVMALNPRYVFFRALDVDPADGPIGTLGCPVTPRRSVAVDPAHVPLGTPVWVEIGGRARLCIAQDTGSAIRGAGRIDLFCGTGVEAGSEAGRLNRIGRMRPLTMR
jgi:membrane-bound lytic murein transglycosylase A